MKAAELDPTDTYIWMRRVLLNEFTFKDFTLYDPSQSAERKAEFLEQVKETERLVAERGDEVWPVVYKTLVDYYKRAGWWDKAYETIKRLQAFEPRYWNHAEQIEGLRLRMASQKVPMPPEWQ